MNWLTFFIGFLFGISVGLLFAVYNNKKIKEKVTQTYGSIIHGKTCPKGHSSIDLLFSVNKIWCFECKKFYPFKLKPNKKSILIKGVRGTHDA